MAHRIQFQDLISHLIDGDAVDWAAARSAAGSAEEAKTLQALEILARIRDASVRHPADAGATLPFPRWRHLRLIDPIGQGQHGELYRAWDESLQLLVALKLLPDGAPPGTQAMLLNEARLLAQVRHDNVVRVHGADLDQGRVAYWMEFLDGATLDPAAVRTPLAAVSIGLEIARALAAIHEAGVVHGDVKPANILRTTSGRTVLVDFSVSRTPTDGDAVRPWVAGTPFYMAPELLLHRVASVPADVYALGVLIFHLATGTYPLNAPDLDALRAAHAAREDRALVVPEHGLPSQLATFLNECLAVDPRHRMQAGEAAHRLQRLLLNLDPRARRRRRRTIAAATAGAALLIAATALLARIRNTGDAHSGPAAPTFTTRQLTSSGVVDDAAISADGTLVAYAESKGIRLMQIASGATTTLLPRSETGALDLAFSPDGTWVYYIRALPSNAISTLCRVPVAGGPPQPLYRDVDGSPTFAPDGRSIVVWRMTQSPRFVTTDLYIGSADGRDSLRLLVRTEDAILSAPLSPDGTAAVTAVLQPAGANSWRLAFVPAGGGQLQFFGPKFPLASDPALWWDSASTGVYVVSGAIHHTRVRDGVTRRVSIDLSGYEGFVASADGQRLVALRKETRTNLWRVPVGRSPRDNTHAATRLTSASGFATSPDVARHGGAIVYTSNASGSQHLWVLDPGRAQTRQLTRGPGIDQEARWSPDGARIAFASQRGDSTHIFTIVADGTDERQLTHLLKCSSPEWTPDGRAIDFTEGEQIMYIYRVQANGGPAAPIRGPRYSQPRWSPDGRTLLCRQSDGNRLRYTLIGTGNSGMNPALAPFGVRTPVAWHPDGQHITMRAKSSAENLANVRLDGAMEPAFTEFRDGLRMLGWCWEPDGRAIICARSASTTDVVLFEAVPPDSLTR